MNTNAILQAIFLVIGLVCVMQAYPMEHSDNSQLFDAETAEKSIVKLCVNLVRSKSIDSLDDSLVRGACYAIYDRMIEENSNSFNRMRRFFALPIAKNQHIQLPPGEATSNTGFKYGRK
jgi:hypothetical protein